MNEEQIVEECIEMIELIYRAGEDVDWPLHDGFPDRNNNLVHILGSSEGYYLQSHYEPKKYDNADAVLDALIVVEKLYGEQYPLVLTYQKLKGLV